MNSKLKKILNKEAKAAYNKSKKEITKGKNIILLLVILIISLVIIVKTTEEKPANTYLNGQDISYLINKKEEAKVVNVIDGDTIEIRFKTGILSDDQNSKYKLRLLGMDTPESKHRDESKNTEEGIEAYNYTKEKLTDKDVTLEFDVSPVDKYNRLLAYVWVDGNMYNKHLLDIGYAKLMTVSPNVKYTDTLKMSQKIAKDNNLGFWYNGEFTLKKEVEAKANTKENMSQKVNFKKDKNKITK